MKNANNKSNSEPVPNKHKITAALLIGNTIYYHKAIKAVKDICDSTTYAYLLASNLNRLYYNFAGDLQIS